jgi:transcription initiation protein SPT3
MEHSRLRVKYHILIDHTFQMMFVSGETADVAPETTSMIEFIVQQQVMEMVSSHIQIHAIA